MDILKPSNRIFGISGESRLFAQGSLAFTGNLNLYLAQLSAGAAVIACDLFDPRLWKHQLEAYRADGIYLIPAKLRALKQVYEREREPEKTDKPACQAGPERLPELWRHRGAGSSAYIPGGGSDPVLRCKRTELCKLCPWPGYGGG